jgi:predicted Zn-dependent peptidase
MEQVVLKNNTKLWLQNRPSDTSVTIVVNFRVGSRDEYKQLIGISHFIEHMMFKGTKTYPTSKILTKKLDSLGAIYNAHTSYDHTQYYIKCVSSVLHECMEILYEMLFESLMLEEDMKKEKKVVIEEINKYKDSPDSAVFEEAYKLTFQGNELGKDIAGSIEAVKNYTKEDVINYYKKYYRPENALVIICGKIDNIDKTKQKINELFGSLKQIDKPKPIKPTNPFCVTQTKYRQSIVKRNLEQEKLMITFPLNKGILDNEIYYTLEVINNILGGNMSSRLFMDIRENKGLCYTIYSKLDFFYETGVWYIFAGITKGKTKEAIKEIIKILKEIRNGKFTDSDLSETKLNLLRKFNMQVESNLNIANFYASQGIYSDKILYNIEEYNQNINNVTKENVVKLCSKILNFNKINLAILK